MTTPRVPTVAVEANTPDPNGPTRYVVVVKRSCGEYHLPAYLSRHLAEHHAAMVRGALADAFLAGRAEAEALVAEESRHG